MNDANQIQFDLESLEPRQMLAGDVTAAIRGNDLIIEGDQQNNEIVIQESANPGEFEVFGANGTTINGQERFTFTSDVDDVRIQLRDGNDRLWIKEMQVGDDVRIRTGDDQDAILIDELTVRGNLRLDTQSGDDAVHFGNAVKNLGNRLEVRTGSGSDQLFLRNSLVDRVDVRTGSGIDQALVSSVDTSRFVMSLGSGDDLAILKNVSAEPEVRGQAGFDTVHSNGFLRSVEWQEVVGYGFARVSGSTVGQFQTDLSIATIASPAEAQAAFGDGFALAVVFTDATAMADSNTGGDVDLAEAKTDLV